MPLDAYGQHSVTATMIRQPLLAFCLLAVFLAGCDQLGIETADKVAARVEAEGKAIGGACRHSGRALEDCYEINRRASKAAMYAGWRDMDAYMRENNIAVVKPGFSDDPITPGNSTKPEAGASKSAANGSISPAGEKSVGNSHTDNSAKAVTKSS